jgi:hypothetical protein
MLWHSYAHGMTPVAQNQITHEFKDHQAPYLDIDVGLTNVYFPYGSNLKIPSLAEFKISSFIGCQTGISFFGQPLSNNRTDHLLIIDKEYPIFHLTSPS